MAASNSSLPVLPTARDMLLGALDRRFRTPRHSSFALRLTHDGPGVGQDFIDYPELAEHH